MCERDGWNLEKYPFSIVVGICRRKKIDFDFDFDFEGEFGDVNCCLYRSRGFPLTVIFDLRETEGI